MDHLADSTAELCQGRRIRYKWQGGGSTDDIPWEECEPVIVFKCMDLSIGQCQWICLDSLVFRTRFLDAGIATRSYVTSSRKRVHEMKTPLHPTFI